MAGQYYGPNETDSGYDVFLGEVASQVDKLVVDPGNISTFRRRMCAFAEGWKKHVAACERERKRRKDHWQKVKKHPAWQDKSGGPPKRGWVWDKDYLYEGRFSDPSGVKAEDAYGGPTREMPASYAEQYIAECRKYIDINQRIVGEKGSQSSEGQNSLRNIREIEWHAKKVETQLKELKERGDAIDEIVWLDADWDWWRYVIASDVHDGQRHIHLQESWINEKLGCWRPPIEEIPDNPITLLMAKDRNAGFPPARNQNEEYQRYYVVLASIHDNKLPEVEKIDNGIWPQELAEGVWFRLTGAQPYGPTTHFIKTALDRVRRKPPGEKPAEKGPKGKPDGKTKKRSKAQKRGKVGRPKVTSDKAERRRKLKADWERYRESGPDARKERFCEDEGIKVEYLNNSVLRWCRDNPRSSRTRGNNSRQFSPRKENPA